MTYTPASTLTALVRGGAVDGVNLVAERVRALSVSLTPINEGDLRSSQTVQRAEEGGTEVEAAVSTDLPYAVRQHEDLSYRHPGGGQAKFLETAALQVGRTEAQQIMARAVSRRMGG